MNLKGIKCLYQNQTGKNNVKIGFLKSNIILWSGLDSKILVSATPQ